MHKRRLVRCLGVSTVVANMLMILITLSLAAILVAWAGTSYGSFSSGSQLFYAQRQQALQERFVIEMVSFNKTGTNHTLMMFVRNVGVQQITIETIYVNGTAAGTSALPLDTTKTYLCTTLPVTLPIGNVCEFRLTWGSTAPYWASGSMFNFVVATARGNQAAYSARGP
jgi:archaellum component FlaG (FlaF/FlaG flagellin family)